MWEYKNKAEAFIDIEVEVWQKKLLDSESSVKL
jgi:hypothetical protein